MTIFSRITISLFIAVFANLAAADDGRLATEEALQIYSELKSQHEGDSQPFMQLMSQFVQATRAAGRCTADWDCAWPTPSCKGNRCVTDKGEGGECVGSWECSWPTPNCRKGYCVSDSGGGSECDGNWNCSWPYNVCKNGFCERD